LLVTANAGFAAEPASASAPQLRAVTPDDMSKIKSPSTPKLSPDGRQVAYALMTNLCRAHDWSNSRAVTSAGSPPIHAGRFCRSLYFLSDRVKKY
jgi:hypothetical protein